MFKKDIKKIKNGYCELNYNTDNADWTVKTYKIIEEKVFINFTNAQIEYEKKGSNKWVSLQKMLMKYKIFIKE